MPCEDCAKLQAQLDRFKAELDSIRFRAGVDLQNAQNDLVAKNRIISQLRNELERQAEEEPEADTVTTILRHWVVACGKKSNVVISPGLRRHKCAKQALKVHGYEACIEAIDGLAKRPFLGPHGGRFEVMPPGGRRLDDIEHALGDEVRVKNCRSYVLGYDPDNPPPDPQLALIHDRPVKPPVRTREVVDDVLDGLTYRKIQWGVVAKDRWEASCPVCSAYLLIGRPTAGVVKFGCAEGCADPSILQALGLGVMAA